ncbi:MAG: NAD-dependent dehydratase [Acidobacteriaceae bacterium]
MATVASKSNGEIERSSTMKILLLGATGLVGKNVLAQALAHPAITGLVAPTRQPLAPHPKLMNPVSDHLKSLLGVTQGVDGVVCALGTTISKAGSKEAFREVDYVLPLAFARSAHEHGAETFVLVSASVASVSSAMFYPRIKGELERDIELVGFRSLTIVRPSLIGGERDEPRIREGVTLRLMSVFAPILPKKFHVNPAPAIAAAILDAVTEAQPRRHFRYSESLV